MRTPAPPLVVLGLNRIEAAAAVGVSAGTFDKMVDEGTMPKPRRYGVRKLWDVDDLRVAFKTLPIDGEPRTGTWADVA